MKRIIQLMRDVVKSGALCNNERGYFWKNYDGDIPIEAVLGGYKGLGMPTYIGQIAHNNDPRFLFVGEIDSMTGILSYAAEYGIPRETQENFQILCTETPEALEWDNYTSLDDPNLTDKNLVYGGCCNHMRYFIGRKIMENRAVIGRVFLSRKDFNIWFAYVDNGVLQCEKENFQVLFLKPRQF